MSTETTPKTYQNIKVEYPSEAVWVSPIESPAADWENSIHGAAPPNGTNYIVLIGPTGSGKSSFIEAIASKSTREPLGIAKDQLESVTQKACIYEIKNLNSYNCKIYIIDTPGFADPRISELHVLDKMTYWRDRCQQTEGAIRLLYFHPITDIRMPASRKQCVDMIQRFWGLRLRERVMLVTSFWDCVPERSRNAAEERFTQISTSYWGDWIEGGSSPAKFHNTFDSAMDILNILCRATGPSDNYPSISGLGMAGTTGNPIYEALSSRLTSLGQQRVTLLEDLAHPTSHGQTELINTLTNELAKVEFLLQKFTAEMDDFLKRFGPPQDSPEDRHLAADAIDPAPTATDTVDINPRRITARPATSPPEIANTASTAVGPKKVSLPKRFGQWVEKNVDRMHLDSFGRKGA